MPRPARQPKRPYVRPRIGYSIYRSLWYAAAFLALLLLAFLMPRTGAPSPSVEGDWLFVAPAPMGDLPAGRSTLLLHGGHYTLRTETGDGTLRVEFGSMTEEGERVLLEPVEALAVDGNGRGTRGTPSAHSFRLHYRNGALALETDAGQKVVGERRPFVPTATGTGEAPR